MKSLERPAEPALGLPLNPSREMCPHIYVGPLQVCVKAPPSGAPRGLKARRLEGGDAVELTWQDACENESAFYVEQRAAGESDYSQVMVIPANFTRFVLGGLAPDEGYSFRLRATNVRGDSGYSNEAGA